MVMVFVKFGLSCLTRVRLWSVLDSMVCVYDVLLNLVFHVERNILCVKLYGLC